MNNSSLCRGGSRWRLVLGGVVVRSERRSARRAREEQSENRYNFRRSPPRIPTGAYVERPRGHRSALEIPAQRTHLA